MSRPGQDARRIAARILSDVLEAGRPLDTALNSEKALGELPTRDRAFARAMVATTLRRLGRVDKAIEPFLDRPLPESARFARALLRIGAAQLLFMETPAHAAVGETTGAAGAFANARRYKGLINAVLRRVAEQGADIIAALGPADDWPAWLISALRGAYGPERAARIAEASGIEPPLDLTVKSGAEAWAKRLGGETTPTGSVRLSGAGDITKLEGYDGGDWWVQDCAAALPAMALGDVAGRRVADLCAAPGGKTLQLVAAGADVTAVDQSAERLKRLSENLARTQLAATVVAADVRGFAPDAPFDAVLLDAPCSATGTLRRHPDAALGRGLKAIAPLAQLQVELLAASAKLAKPGAPVIFCTCSLLPAEGEQVVERVLEEGAALTRDPISPAELPGLPAEAFTPDGCVRTTPEFWSERGGMDGFFIARMRRV